MDLEKVADSAGGAIDDRFHAAKYARKALKKAFPDQWSFFLGELALYSFIILLVTGTYLALFFHPSEHEIIYHGSYAKLNGVSASEAYVSAVNISFDVRGGLLVRQIHHWAALIFVGAIAVHALRIFFTGAFRKPREVNWVIGTTMFALACAEGFAGYSLPDDLLSGTGVRIAEGIMQSIPIVGTYVVFFAFGGQYPGEDFIPRLYIAHVLLLPGLILALVTAHVMILWHQGHTQWPGKKEKEHVEVGAPFFPVFIMKTTGLFMFVFAGLAVLAAFAQINPIWLYGPYNPVIVSNGSQPDWYIGFLEGALRMMPGVESNVAGHTLVWNVFIPAVVLPVVFFACMYAYPFFERWVTGDARPHNVLDRPRYTPTRTGIGVAVLTSAIILQLAGAQDVIAYHFGLVVEDFTWVMRVSFFVLPVIAFLVTRHFCVALQRADRRRLRVGHRYAIAGQSPDGDGARRPPAGAVTPPEAAAGRPGSHPATGAELRLGPRSADRAGAGAADRAPPGRAHPAPSPAPHPAADPAPHLGAGPCPAQPLLPAVRARAAVQGRPEREGRLRRRRAPDPGMSGEGSAAPVQTHQGTDPREKYRVTIFFWPPVVYRSCREVVRRR